MPLRRKIDGLLMKLAANKFAQKFLTRRLKKTLKFLGVGIGGSVTKSGEHGVLQKLKELNLVQLCLFDVGANKGDWSQRALDFFAEKQELVIHAFEPAKTTFNNLRDHLKDEHRVIINHSGLGREVGQMDLFYAGEAGSIASLTQR